jgi:hypothetical protein
MRHVVASGWFAGILLVLGSCGGDPDPGVTCRMDDECEPLSCLCFGHATGTNPGVCSRTCSSKADCTASFGDVASCVTFCTGVNLCLLGYTGGSPTLP